MDALPHTALASLRTLAGRLIPASAAFGAPGADDDAIFAAIAAALQPALPMLGAFIADLGADEGRAIAERPLDEWLAHLAATHQGAFAVFSAAVIQAYYRDDRWCARSARSRARPSRKAMRSPRATSRCSRRCAHAGLSGATPAEGRSGAARRGAGAASFTSRRRGTP